MRSRPGLFVAAILAVVLAASSGMVSLQTDPVGSAPVPPEPTPAPTPTPIAPAVRVHDGSKSVTLEVATRELVDDRGRRVVLTGAVHVGQQSYYDALRLDLSGCEAVFFEGLASRDGGPAEDAVVRWAALAEALGVVYQSDVLDTEREGWVHADLDADVLRARMLAAGADPKWVALVLDPPLPKGLRAFLDGMERADPRTRALTRLSVVDTLGDVDLTWEGREAELYQAFVLDARNAVVTAAIDVHLADGLEHGCVLYGAAHLTGLESVLRERGFSRASERWDVAMDVPLASLGMGPVQLKQYRRVYGR